MLKQLDSNEVTRRAFVSGKCEEGTTVNLTGHLDVGHHQNRMKTSKSENYGTVNRRLIVKMISEELNINRKTVRPILTDNLGMKKVCAKMVPKRIY
jgi:hypothetical protein